MEWQLLKFREQRLSACLVSRIVELWCLFKPTSISRDGIDVVEYTNVNLMLLWKHLKCIFFTSERLFSLKVHMKKLHLCISGNVEGAR